MTAPMRHRGGAPVGLVADLDAVEAAAVLYLRLWSDGAGARERIVADLTRCLGPDAGPGAARRFEELCTLCAQYGRRPLLRHDIGCKCLGADEACFANFIATASEGAREDAALIATMLVRPDVALAAADLAQSVGLAFRRVALVTAGRRSTLH